MKRGILILIFFVFCGCSAKRTADSGVLRIRLRENPTTLDPAYIVDVAGGVVSAKLYNGLVKVDELCRIMPDIAELWDISEDGMTYSFRLRKDVRFSDGKLLTADIVKKSFERIIKESPRKWIFEKAAEIRVKGDLELEIRLTEPYSPFLSMLSMPNAYISLDGKTGTGPYRLVKWEHDKKLTLEPNPFYFGDRPKPKGIEYQIIPEEFTAQTEFDLGNLDIMEVPPIQWLAKVSDAGCRTYRQTGLNTYYVGFNCRNPLLKRIKVRHGLNYAIDRKAIIKSVLQGQAEPAWGPVPPVLNKSSDYYPYKYLPNKAKRLLSGFKTPLKLYVRAQAQAIQIAEVIQYFFNKAGVELAIVPLEWSAFKKAIDTGDADLFLMSWWADYPDPENFLFPTFHSKNLGAGGNRAYYKNKKIDKLIEESQNELDTAKRDELYGALQRYISRQSPWIFLWHAKELYITQSWVEGFKLYPIYNGDKGTGVDKSGNLE